MKYFLILFLLLFNLFVGAHEGHHEAAKNLGHAKNWTQWIGSFHLILLHFPIALINMLAVSEAMYVISRRPLYDFSSRFLLLSSALLSPPTAVFGLVYSFSSTYLGLMNFILNSHMWFGIATAVLAVFLLLIQKEIGNGKVYYSFLIILVLLVNITGFFGGSLTFGPYQIMPPID